MKRLRLPWWLTEYPIVWAGRLGCRLLDRHHYLACRGRMDHTADATGRIVRRQHS